MVTALLTFWRGLQSKAAIYGALALAILAAIAQVFTAGRTKERLAQAEAKAKETKRNAEIAAIIDSLSSTDVRDRLHNDWSTRE